MTDVFDFHDGSSALLISIPHDGRLLAPGQAERMTDVGRALPDTDWHVRELYSFAGELGASVIAANYSRYVVDLNRPSTDDSPARPWCSARSPSRSPTRSNGAGTPVGGAGKSTSRRLEQ